MTSVLDQMTAGIRKQADAKLTPVEGEAAEPVAQFPEVPGVFLTKEALTDIASDLRKQSGILIDVADGIDAMVGVPKAAAIFERKQKATEVKLKEREADRKVASGEVETIQPNPAVVETVNKFEADLAAKAAAAQAATFAAADAGADEDEAVPSPGSWECPTHGSANLADLTARGGRKYKACNKCDAFQRK